MSHILTTEQTISNWIHYLMACMSDLAAPIEEDENEAYFEMDPGLIDGDDEDDEYGNSEDDDACEDDEDDLG